MFLSYASRNSELLLRLKSQDNREIHIDGGKYHVMAMDCSDDHKSDISGSYNNNGWENFYGIVCDNLGDCDYERFYWLGVCNFFDKEARPEIVTGEEKTQALLYRLFCNVIKEGFSLDSLNIVEKEKLAKAIKSGLVHKSGNSYKLNFVVFSKDQLAKLQNEIYEPLLATIIPKLDELAKQFGKIHKSDFPKAKQGNIDHHIYLDLWMFGIFTLMFAVEDNLICLPKTSADGAPLTLVLVKE
jgi:hypothetical protein